jgi:hypothetical protein
VVPLLLLTACLERVTDVAVPLDPRFYAGGGEADNPSGAGERLGPPWEGVEGAHVPVIFTVETPGEGSVQFDVIEADAAAPGGVRRVGRVEGASDTVTLSVPVAVKAFTVEAFQDADGDGPSPSDPYASIPVDMGTVAGPILVKLVPGSRPAPGGGGAGPGPTGGDGGVVEPWRDITGPPRVDFLGVIASPVEGEIQIDVTEPAPSEPGGQRRVGQVRLPEAGAFMLAVPTDREKFRLEAFVDLEADGPTDDDPYAELTVVVSSIRADEVVLTLVPGSRGAAGSGAGPPAGGGSPAGGPGGPNEAPWSDYTGPTRTFTAKVTGEWTGELQVDVTQPDPAAPGGQRRMGQLRLRGTGDIELKVPLTVDDFRVEVFADAKRDGPTDEDPWGAIEVTAQTIGKAATIPLSVGARGKPSAPASAPAPAGGPPADIPFVRVGGKVSARLPHPIYVDLFTAPAGAGGRKHLGKVEARDGAWTARVIPDLGPIVIEAYQDPDRDGPTKGDAKVSYPSPVVVGKDAITGIDLVLP